MGPADRTGADSGDRPGDVAIVGIGARFAGGVASAGDLWDLLTSGATTDGEVPPQRWRAYREHSREHAAALDRVVARGSFLDDDVAGFDAAFFGISGREAEQLDPQQRTALEVAWEALEDAGVPPPRLAGSDTAVYLGVGTDDYGRRLVEDLPRVRAWTGIGASLCGVPNRVSHALDLRGASVAVDTACSSSLVAVHQACTALRAGETSLALAGGVMLMSGPGLTAVLTEAGAVGPDGRSKPFDAAANGYGRGEGCGVVVLKRLADARADGDDVLAIVRGGAVRQDGRTEGIMAPSGSAQADLMRAAYAAADVDPATVGYVEAHGTGTPTGDPIEGTALCAVLGRSDDLPACRVGSVKASLGHTEAAAGVAGLIAAVQVLRHRRIPAIAGLTRVRDDVPWAAAHLFPGTRAEDWAAQDGHPRRAGVASYGYGGTIAHLVLEEGDPAPGDPAPVNAAPAAAATVAPDAGGPARTPFPLSAASPEALAEQARRLAVALAAPDAPATTDVATTLWHGRAHLRSRAVVTADSRDGLLAGLRTLADGGIAPSEDSAFSLVTGTARPSENAVWVFSGHGAQWAGMGRGLLDADPAFTEVIDRLAPVYRTELGATPREMIEADDLGGVDRIQATLCAVQLGLAASWRARGTAPAAVIGHSVGEIAAAVVSGALDETSGARLVCRRSALLPRAAGRGAMALVDLAFDDCAADLAAESGVDAAIAASPGSTVVAGDPDAVERVAARWEGEGRTVRRVDSDVAFHTAHMQPLADDLAVAVADLEPSRPVVPRYTTALDDPRGDHRQDARYWAANLRNPVRFAEAVTAAVQDGHRTFLEVSAHPVVAHSITETLAAQGVDDGVVLPSLRRHRPEAAALDATAAALHCRGVHLDPPVPAGRRVRLPGTVWRHRRFWTEHLPDTPPGPAHTLLGPAVDVHGLGTQLWSTTVSARTRPYPGHHPVLDTEIVPAAVTLLTYLAAGSTEALSDVVLRRPVVVPGDEDPDRELQVVREGDALRLASRSTGGDWSVHSEARVDAAPRLGGPSLGGPSLDDSAAGDPLDAGTVVDRLAELGVAAMGFPWRVEKLRRGENLLVADVATDPDGVLRHRDPASLLDAALSAASVVFTGAPVLRMPAAIDRVLVDVEAAGRAERAQVVAAPDPERELTVDVELRAEDGTVLGRLDGIRYAEPDGVGTARPELAETVFTVGWADFGSREGATDSAGTVVVEPSGPAGAALAGLLAPVTRGPDAVPGAGPPDATVARSGAAGGVAAVVVDDRHLPDDRQPGPDRRRGWPGSGPIRRSPEARPTVTERPADPPDRSGDTVHLLVAAAEQPRDAVPALIDAVRSAEETPGTRVWAVTRGLRSGAAGPGDAAVAGLGRVLATEHPETFGGVLDLDPDPDRAAAAVPALLRRLARTDREPVTAADDAGLHVPRAVPLGRDGRAAPVCRPDGTYLVTGGLGAVGSAVAVHLAERGARRIVLLGHTPLPPRSEWDENDPRVRAVLDVERAGAAVFPVTADVTDPGAVRAALDALPVPPVRGVVHAAGQVRSAPARDLTADDLDAVLAAKADGAQVLDGLFPPGGLDFLVLFSSSGPLLGLPGQAAYAAANGVLDGLAATRRAAGDTGCVSIAWTSWRGLGMATSAAATDVELDARGTADLTPDRALAALDRVLAARHGLGTGPVLVTPVRTDHTGPRPSLVEGLAPADDTADDGGASWAGLSGPELSAELTAVASAAAAAVLGTDPDAVTADAALGELGVDSLMGSMLRLKLERATGLALSPALLWNHPTTGAIAAHLATRLDDGTNADDTGADDTDADDTDGQGHGARHDDDDGDTS